MRNTSKIISFILSLVLILSCFATTAFASGVIEEYEGVIEPVNSGISTVADENTTVLTMENAGTPADFAALLNANPAGNFVLTSDLDWAGATAVMITEDFAGTLDGNGYTIKNFALGYTNTTTWDTYFFTSVSGTVKNLGFVLNITAANNNYSALFKYNTGTIENIYVDATYTASMGTAYTFLTVLATQESGGTHYAGTFRNCVVVLHKAEGVTLTAQALGAIAYSTQAANKVENVILVSNGVTADNGSGTTVNAAAVSYPWGGTMSGNKTYADMSALTAEVTGFDSANGWSDSWSIVDGAVKFAHLTKYNVTLPSGEGYTVSGDAQVVAGNDYTFTVTPELGYKVTSVTVNGTPYTGTDGTYTVPAADITGDLTVAVTTKAGPIELNQTNAGTPADFAALLNANPAGKFVLTSDLDWAGATAVMITEDFAGTLDGNGYTIKNFALGFTNTTTWDTYFFTSVSGTVKNLGFVLNITAANNNYSTLFKYNTGTIENIYVDATYTATVGTAWTFLTVLATQESPYAGTFRNCVVVLHKAEGVTLTAQALGAIAYATQATNTVENVILVSNGVTADNGSGTTVNAAAVSYPWGGTMSGNKTYADMSALTAEVTDFDANAGWSNNWSIVDGTVKFAHVNEYSVTLPSGEGYAVSGADTVIEGKDYTFTVTPELGYEILSVKVGDTVLTGSNGAYTVLSVTGDITITVEVIKRTTLTMANAGTPADFAALLNASPDGNFILGEDLDWAGATAVMITEDFAGTLDGNGYTIKNFALGYTNTTTWDTYFFTSVSGTVKNLGFVLNITAANNNYSALFKYNTGTIENIYVDATYTASIGTAYTFLTVLATQQSDGTYYAGTFRNCVVVLHKAEGVTLTAQALGAIAYSNNASNTVENVILVSNGVTADNGSGTTVNAAALSYPWGGTMSGNTTYADMSALTAEVTDFDANAGWTDGFWHIRGGNVKFGRYVGPTVVTPTMNGGAEIRVDGIHGVRFSATIEKALIEALVADGYTVEFGLAIMPLDYVSKYGALTEANLFGAGAIYCFKNGEDGIRIINIVTALGDALNAPNDSTKYKINGSILSIKDGNLDRAFTSRAYVKVTDGDGVVTYMMAAEAAEADASRSAIDVAAKGYDYVSAAHQDIFVKQYLGKLANIKYNTLSGTDYSTDKAAFDAAMADFKALADKIITASRNAYNASIGDLAIDFNAKAEDAYNAIKFDDVTTSALNTYSGNSGVVWISPDQNGYIAGTVNYSFQTLGGVSLIQIDSATGNAIQDGTYCGELGSYDVVTWAQSYTPEGGATIVAQTGDASVTRECVLLLPMINFAEHDFVRFTLGTNNGHAALVRTSAQQSAVNTTVTYVYDANAATLFVTLADENGTVLEEATITDADVINGTKRTGITIWATQYTNFGISQMLAGTFNKTLESVYGWLANNKITHIAVSDTVYNVLQSYDWDVNALPVDDTTGLTENGKTTFAWYGNNELKAEAFSAMELISLREENGLEPLTLVSASSLASLDDKYNYLVIGDTLATEAGLISDGTFTTDSGYMITKDSNRIYLYGRTGLGTLNAVYALLDNFYDLEFYSDTVYTFDADKKDFTTAGIESTASEITKSIDYNWSNNGLLYLNGSTLMNIKYCLRLGYVNYWEIQGGNFHALNLDNFSSYKTTSVTDFGGDSYKIVAPDASNTGLVNAMADYLNTAMTGSTKTHFFIGPADYMFDWEKVSSTDYVNFANAVAEKLDNENTYGKQNEIVILLYTGYLESPQSEGNTVSLYEGDEIKVSLMFAPITMNINKSPTEDTAKSFHGYTNAQVYTEYDRWNSIANGRMYVWAYSCNFSNTFVPVDNIYYMRENYERMIGGGTMTHFMEQGSQSTPVQSNLTALRVYLQSKLAFDADMTSDEYDALVKNFCKVYYGDTDANPAMYNLVKAEESYLESLPTTVKGSTYWDGNKIADDVDLLGFPSSLTTKSSSLFGSTRVEVLREEYWTYNTSNVFSDWYAYITSAYTNSLTAEQRAHIEIESISLRYLSLKICGTALVSGDTVATIKTLAKSHGITHYGEGLAIDDLS